jgi:LacI family transcriptional regulator
MVGSSPNAHPSFLERRRGYLDALKEHGISETYAADCVDSIDEQYNAALRLIQEHPQMTAIFGINDETAISTMRAAKALGINVPDSISIVGFDDIELSRLITPALTTMAIDKLSMGQVAVQALINRVQMPNVPPITTAIQAKLIQRQSVARITAAKTE